MTDPNGNTARPLDTLGTTAPLGGDEQDGMSITEGESVLPAVTPRWCSLYSWTLFVLGFGTI